MLKKAGRSERKGEEVRTALRVGRSLLQWILANGQAPPVIPISERLNAMREPLSDTRTPFGEWRVSARRGWAGEKSDFFNILLGGIMYTSRPHDHEPARASVTSLYGKRWLKGYVRGKLRIDPMYGIVFEYSTPPQIASDSDQSSSDQSGML